MKRVSNPPNPWHTHSVEWLGEPPEAQTHLWEQKAKTVLAQNSSPDVPFRWSVNPYRGCQHACAYCYARPSHQYLDFGAGTDFERQLVVKTNAPELLREAFLRRSWNGDMIAFSGNTDCYQPIEASYQLTRRCLEVCAEFQNPVGIITKGALARRDIDVFQELSRSATVFVWLSIPWADDSMGHAIEPGCTIPSQRFKTLRLLAEAGIPCGVAIAPIIPGLNDSQVPEILARAADCGVSRAFSTLLRLPKEVRPVFEERLQQSYPLRAQKVLNAIRDMRGGELNVARFGERMRGRGARWDAIDTLFTAHCRRHGLESGEMVEPPNTFRRPTNQLALL